MGTRKKIEIATPDDVERFASPTPAAEPLKPAEPSAEGASAEGAAPAAQGAAPADETAVLRKQVEELQDKLLRAKAELENLRRRSQQERIDAVRFANWDFAGAMLAVLDNFERAFQAAAAPNASAESVVEGARLVYESLKKVLANHQIEEIPSDRQEFDPRLHQAVMQQFSDELPNHTILQTIEKGYKYHERVLRPAKVIVSKSKEPETAPAVQTRTETPEA